MTMIHAREPTFLLGLGAQKSGTTWLHHCLTTDPGFAPGALKEYHVWDAVAVPAFAHKRLPAPVDARAPSLRYQLQQSPAAYFDYFAQLLAAPEYSLTADITPSYAGLSATTLSQIDAGFHARGILCKVIFLMRDPVERLWSAVRMNRGTYMARKSESDPDFDENARLLQKLGKPVTQVRGRYDLSIQAIEAAFPPERIYIGLFEDLFAGRDLDRLSAFLGVPITPELLKDRIRANEKVTDLTPEVRMRIASEFASVYDFCAQRMPQIADLWPSYKERR